MKTHRVSLSLSLSIALVAMLGAPASLVLADGGTEHQAEQAWPIELGTSGGTPEDASGPYCCGGTLGALLTDGAGGYYILSNNHVMARFNQASIGEPIHHPALIDTGCIDSPSNEVGTLFDFVEISASGTNQVDAAIALADTAAIDLSGAILDIGPVSSTTLAPSIGLGIQKSGRTTGHTTGTIDAVNVTINVAYRKKCNGGQQVVATFTDCFRTTSGFSAGGDSGSLIVEDVASSPRPVGLLFAGNTAGVTFGNPIDLVLDSFGLAFVGGAPPPPPPPPATGSISGTITDAGDGSPIAGVTVSLDTGDATTSAGDGSYAFADVPTGTHTVSASAAGYTGANANTSVLENQNSVVDLALDAVPAGSSAIVQCVRYRGYGGNGAGKHLEVVIVVVDDLGFPVDGAAVSIELSIDGSPATGTASTDAAGEARFTLRNAANVCYSTDVTALDAPGLSWDGTTVPNGFQKGADASPDEDCIGSTDGCAGAAPTAGVAGGPGLPSTAAMQAAMAVQDIHAPGLLGVPNVVGLGTSWNANGEPVIEIYLKQGPPAGLPTELDGVPTRFVETGEIEAF